VPVVVDVEESGRLGVRHGVWKGAADAVAAARPSIERASRALGLAMVVLELDSPTLVDGATAVGVLEDFEAPIPSIEAATAGAATLGVELLLPGEWEVVAPLLPYASPSRFSRDARLDPRLAAARKLRVLQDLERVRNGHGALWPGRDTPLAFQYSCVVDNRWVPYELVIAPGVHAGGAIGVALLACSLAQMRARMPEVEVARTAIFSDNVLSARFFGRLGFTPTGRRRCYYHLWL
jgi:hypothetical protein